ncbi:MAG: leader peptidase (prepilin peptidase)/N-methyltransferase [Akkermansiaceae bacterium]
MFFVSRDERAIRVVADDDFTDWPDEQGARDSPDPVGGRAVRTTWAAHYGAEDIVENTGRSFHRFAETILYFFSQKQEGIRLFRELDCSLFSAYFSGVEEIWYSTVMAVGIVFIGLCVGSFLNVAIHRLPRGLSVNDPKRSFCPHCKSTLPAWQNLPIITWLLQRGKCRTCSAPIAVRYLLVEALTGALYFAAWYYFPMVSAILAILLFTILVTVAFIDAEHQLIPISWTTAGVVLALLGSLFTPRLLDLQQKVFHWLDDDWLAGLRTSGLGWLVGFGSLWGIVLLGKLIWGRLKHDFKEAVPWNLQEGYEENPQLHWMLEDEAHSWDDLFFRASDELVIQGHGFKVDGKREPAKEIVIRRDDFSIGEKKWSIENLKSLEGKAHHVSIPREAMGMGDPHLLGMIGAFLGWQAVIFVIFSSSLYAIAAALVTRVGFGKPLPYGPFLALGALTWVFGGWQLWVAYFRSLEGAF